MGFHLILLQRNESVLTNSCAPRFTIGGSANTYDVTPALIKQAHELFRGEDEHSTNKGVMNLGFILSLYIATFKRGDTPSPGREETSLS